MEFNVPVAPIGSDPETLNIKIYNGQNMTVNVTRNDVGIDCWLFLGRRSNQTRTHEQHSASGSFVLNDASLDTAVPAGSKADLEVWEGIGGADPRPIVRGAIDRLRSLAHATTDLYVVTFNGETVTFDGDPVTFTAG